MAEAVQAGFTRCAATSSMPGLRTSSRHWPVSAMLVPFALFGTLAVRRPAALVAASVLLSGTVEYLQGATGGGTCQLRDIAHNTGGAALAVALGWGWLHARESSRESRRGRTATDAPGW